MRLGSLLVRSARLDRARPDGVLRSLVVLTEHLRSHFRSEVRLGTYLSLGVFLTVMLVVNYGGEVSLEVLVGRIPFPLRIFASFALYAIPYYFGVLAYVIFHKKTSLLRRPGFWASSLFALFTFATYVTFDHHIPWIRGHVPVELQAYALQCLANLAPACWGSLLLFAYWFLIDRRLMPFYGLKVRGLTLSPYAVLVLFAVPPILFASFFPDFLATYPRYRASSEIATLGVAPWQAWCVFQICYGADFVFTEIFFRGFLILGLARWLGSGAVLPMVAFYMCIHFGKPAGEAVASIFGGWALGVIALRTKAIWGGIVFHLGVAYTMEIAAMWQKSIPVFSWP